ncbi:MAG: DUF2281 domain-containing protein [Deltaproteobacteria bacterium]|nr:DUF2281 domain-containing protein [Deltaproteobacteria bacterium]
MQHDTVKENEQQGVLIKKIRALSPDKIAEVEDFIDFLNTKNQDRGLTRAYYIISEKSFQDVWDNPEDDEYDRL